MTELAELIGRSPSATSRIVSELVRARPDGARPRRSPTDASGRSCSRPPGATLLASVDRGRADQFLAVVRPLPMAERALVAMGVAALASHAMTRRGRLIKSGG